ncbi:hypothetical protein ARMGADRAFT_1132723 [Armillaria gallica]|uniref:Uncharacterized protein n=1 Tax=Armillaria gallica TaxID=47427 RepID=A0A2H3D161_ARMGA|nr:hypothetical protein ARMGADRAFT_1132723 [Armillaria gallica]
MGPSSAADAALFLEWCAAMLHWLGACVLLFPWAQVLLPLLPHFFLDGGVLDSVFAFRWFRSIGPTVPAAALFLEIVCCNIARPRCSRAAAFGFQHPLYSGHCNHPTPFIYGSGTIRYHATSWVLLRLGDLKKEDYIRHVSPTISSVVPTTIGGSYCIEHDKLDGGPPPPTKTSKISSKMKRLLSDSYEDPPQIPSASPVLVATWQGNFDEYMNSQDELAEDQSIVT